MKARFATVRGPDLGIWAVISQQSADWLSKHPRGVQLLELLARLDYDDAALGHLIAMLTPREGQPPCCDGHGVTRAGGVCEKHLPF